ncbi:MAG: entericidin A/B family lipoprotein [Planctomycetota bacterium]|jgi:entericidin B
MFRKFLLVIALIFVVYSLTGCHTVQGIGEDIKSVGEAGEEVFTE